MPAREKRSLEAEFDAFTGVFRISLYIKKAHVRVSLLDVGFFRENAEELGTMV